MPHDLFCSSAAHTRVVITEGIAMECLLINYLGRYNDSVLAKHITTLAAEFRQQLDLLRHTVGPTMRPELDLITARAKNIELILNASSMDRVHDAEQAEAALKLVQDNIKALNDILAML